jgi:molybdopterin molybdotransferase
MSLQPQKSRKLLDDCFLHDRDRLKHDEAIAILKARVTTVVAPETVDLIEAGGRVLASSAVATNPVPLHTNAAVDGYSFAASSYDRQAGKTFPISGRHVAGPAATTPVPAGSAVRIFTGAALPPGVDTVVMQEDCQLAPDLSQVTVPAGLKPQANVRRAGEDVAAGTTLIDAGHVIRPQDLAGLASIGMARVPVFQRLRVGILSSGDEVVRPGVPLAPGQVFDANMPMLTALIASAGATFVDLGIAPDRADRLHAMLLDAARRCDVIITSGGASRGEEDHLITALDTLGKRHLWQLAIKPGRPMSFGQISDCVVLGLPGNPVAVFVCFLLYAWPLLRRMGGAPWPEPQRYRLPAAFTFNERKTGRREYWRGMHTMLDGVMAVDKFKRDGSGLISGLRAADGLIEIPEDLPHVRPGDLVTFIPFSAYGF